MQGRHVLGLDNAPRYAYAVAGVLVVAVVYSVLLVAVVEPALPAGARVPAGMVVQLVVFTGAAVALFALRSSDATAALSVLALALSGIANAGPGRGVEWTVPFGPTLAAVAAVANPLAFPIIALAILYFPSRSPRLVRHPWIHVVPPLAAAPMFVLGAARALSLAGVARLAPVVSWDLAHPAVYYGSFALALGLNVAAIVEGVYRYRFNHDANERRRIRMAVYTAVPGVLAYAVKEGLPAAAQLLGAGRPAFPPGLAGVLQAFVLLPAFGLTYAVGVQRVLGPRVVLRRSLQYALASRTLTVLASLPAIALAWTLVHDRNERLRDIATSRAAMYLALLTAGAVAIRYRERARAWLDQRFFREEYDARKILLSLASRVRFETDPADLASLVVRQIDEALHPEVTAILAAGLAEGRLLPVAWEGREIAPLAEDGGLSSLLKWSDEPLEIFLDDPRSSARRLPSDEQQWLDTTGARLLVPVHGADHRLVGAMVLGEKRSEEAYSDEDRQLLASIAAQVGLGFDVARLRARSAAFRDDLATTRPVPASIQPMVECPRCGRCEEAGTAVCPSDGAMTQLVPGVPRVVENKYRIEQLLGRGGMGAVYRARDVRLDRLVALKVVRADLLSDQDTRQRFRREAQIVAKLQHPSIVAVYDYGTFPDGGAYLVMELVRGEDLRRVLTREGRLEERRALAILAAVCSAIESAHREGVLHRDLKPENILLPGGSVEAKVLDFGVAKVMQQDRQLSAAHVDPGSLVTAPGMIVGTPAYMPPEGFHGISPDARGDIFSLGVIAYEMLTGELPFGRGPLAEIVLAHARGVRPVAGAGLRPGLERALLMALQADPDKRPPSVHAFAQLLASA